MIRIALGLVLLTASSVSALSTPRVYALRWTMRGGSSEQRALSERFDLALRAELARRGARVVDGATPAQAITLQPRIEVLPGALSLRLVGVRATDQSLLGTISAKAAGATREAQVKALAAHAGAEAEQL